MFAPARAWILQVLDCPRFFPRDARHANCQERSQVVPRTNTLRKECIR